MKSMLSSLSIFVVLFLLSSMAMAYGKDNIEKGPDQDIDYSTNSASGLYSIRLAIPYHDYDGNYGEHQTMSDIGAMTQFTRHYQFKNHINIKAKKLHTHIRRVSFPLVSSQEQQDENMSDNDGKYRLPQDYLSVSGGNLILIVDNDNAYYIYEQMKRRPDENIKHPELRDDEPRAEDEKWTNVKCLTKKVKWPHKHDALKKARFDKVNFHHSKLCNVYTNLGGWCGSDDDKEQRCSDRKHDITYSEVSIDAFTHKPVEMFINGKLKREHPGRQADGETPWQHPLTHELHFWLTKYIKTFEFGMDHKTEKEMFSIPEKVKHLCWDQQQHADNDAADGIIDPYIDMILMQNEIELE